jgi:hypothetical protein
MMEMSLPPGPFAGRRVAFQGKRAGAHPWGWMVDFIAIASREESARVCVIRVMVFATKCGVGAV